MNKYYELDDDLHVKGRWQLAGPVDDEDRDDREFSYGQAIKLRGPLMARIHTSGLALDFTHTVSMVPVLSQRMAEAIRPLIDNHAQMFPVYIPGYRGFEVLNTIMLIPCLDEHLSEFTKWTAEDGRPDKIGDYQMVTRLRIDAHRVPRNLHVFRVKGWKIALIVSQAFVDAILPLNPTGVKLELVT